MNPAAAKLMLLIDPVRHRRPGDHPRLPAAHPVGIALAAVVTALAAACLAPAPLALVAAAVAIFIPALVWTDLDLHRLPDALTRPASVAVMTAATITAVATDAYDHLLLAVAVAVVAALAFCLLGIAVPGGPGCGDAKLAPILVLPLAWHSVTTPLTWVLLSCATSCIAAVVLLARQVDRHQHLPFGPAMCLVWFVSLGLARAGLA